MTSDKALQTRTSYTWKQSLHAVYLHGNNLLHKSPSILQMGDLKYLNRFHLYQGGMTISGLCVLCLPLPRSFGSIAAIFTVFGLMNGAMNGQYALLLLECTGRRQVNRAWGYMMLFSGLSVGLGSPLAGELHCSGFNICLPD